MRPVSARFLDAITGSHTIATRLRAVPAGQTGTSPTGGVTLSLLAGDVVLDGTADIRSSLSCDIEATDAATGELLWPAGSTSTLTPYGVDELFVERGVAFGGGAVEYVSLGYFRIDDVEQDGAPDGPIRLSGTDRMSHVIDAKMTAPAQFLPTDDYGTVVSSLVLDAYADAVIEWVDPDGVQLDAIGRTAVVDDDRYGFLNELLTGIGKSFYFDHRGVLVIKTDPDPGLPVWTVSRGERGVLVSASRSLSRSGVYNGVIATGEGMDTDAPARGVAVDGDPDSPTFWGGPFGKVPRNFASPLLTTDAQAVLAAETVLRRSTGLPYSVEFTAVPNPALEPSDPIAIGIEGTPRVVLPELLAADSFTRTVVNGVGTDDTGHAWSAAAGTDTTSAVGSGVLSKTLGNNIVATSYVDSALARTDVDLYCDVRAPVTTTGASMVGGFILRRGTDAPDYYAVRIEFNTSGSVSYKTSDGAAEIFALANVDAYTSGQWWSVRAQAYGDSIRFKAWPQAQDEPQAWTYTLSGLREESYSGGNRFGLFHWRVGGNTNTAPQFQNDNFQAYSVPATPLRGGELHVLDTLTVPLVASGALRGTTRQQTLVTIETSS